MSSEGIYSGPDGYEFAAADLATEKSLLERPDYPGTTVEPARQVRAWLTDANTPGTITLRLDAAKENPRTYNVREQGQTFNLQVRAIVSITGLDAVEVTW